MRTSSRTPLADIHQENTGCQQQWLRDLTNRIHGVAATRDPVANRTQASQRLLSVRAGSLHLAIPLETFTEILMPQQITPLPFVADSVSGVINLRGEVLSVISLSHYLGCESSADTSTDKRRFLVVRAQPHSIATVLIVDSINGLHTDESPSQESAEHREIPSSDTVSARLPIDRWTTLSGHETPVVNLQKLVSATDFLKLSAMSA